MRVRPQLTITEIVLLGTFNFAGRRRARLQRGKIKISAFVLRYNKSLPVMANFEESSPTRVLNYNSNDKKNLNCRGKGEIPDPGLKWIIIINIEFTF